MPTRIEVNVQTKEVIEIELTQKEIDDAKARSDDYDQSTAADKQKKASRQISEKLADVGLTVDDIKAAIAS